jgi:hypothetical protein
MGSGPLADVGHTRHPNGNAPLSRSCAGCSRLSEMLLRGFPFRCKHLVASRRQFSNPTPTDAAEPGARPQLRILTWMQAAGRSRGRPGRGVHAAHRPRCVEVRNPRGAPTAALGPAGVRVPWGQGHWPTRRNRIRNLHKSVFIAPFFLYVRACSSPLVNQKKIHTLHLSRSHNPPTLYTPPTPHLSTSPPPPVFPAYQNGNPGMPPPPPIPICCICCIMAAMSGIPPPPPPIPGMPGKPPGGMPGRPGMPPAPPPPIMPRIMFIIACGPPICWSILWCGVMVCGLLLLLLFLLLLLLIGQWSFCFVLFRSCFCCTTGPAWGDMEQEGRKEGWTGKNMPLSIHPSTHPSIPSIIHSSTHPSTHPSKVAIDLGPVTHWGFMDLVRFCRSCVGFRCIC